MPIQQRVTEACSICMAGLHAGPLSRRLGTLSDSADKSVPSLTRLSVPSRGRQAIPRSQAPLSPQGGAVFFRSATLPFLCTARIAGMIGLPLLIDVPERIYRLSMLIRPVPPPSARIFRHRVFAEPSSLGEGSTGRWCTSSLAHLPPLDLDFVRSWAPLLVSGAFFSPSAGVAQPRQTCGGCMAGLRNRHLRRRPPRPILLGQLAVSSSLPVSVMRFDA